MAPSTRSIRSAQPEPTLSCPSCGTQIPLTRALRADLERELRAEYEQKLAADRVRAEEEAARRAEQDVTRQLADLREALDEQTRQLEESRKMELAMRRRERELEREKADLQVTIERTLAEERGALIKDAQDRVLEQHRLKDAEKERQLAEMRRQIEDLKRKADQGSQQLQGEAGEEALEATLRNAFPADEITGIAQGVRGADLHQIVVDSRGGKRGSLLWECKNARHWSDGWIAKLKTDQRALRADVAILVTAALPKDCRRFTLIDGVLVTDFACAAALAAVVRANLLELAHARSTAIRQHGTLELLHRYLSGLEFRQRVEAIVEAFTAMRADLEQERRAAERSWARRAKQIDAVTLNVSGFYGDLQGLVPALPPIGLLQLPGAGADAA
jgi:hypothetical protein